MAKRVCIITVTLFVNDSVTDDDIVTSMPDIDYALRCGANYSASLLNRKLPNREFRVEVSD